MIYEPKTRQTISDTLLTANNWTNCTLANILGRRLEMKCLCPEQISLPKWVCRCLLYWNEMSSHVTLPAEELWKYLVFKQ